MTQYAMRLIMLSHNDDQYLKMVKIMDKIKIFFCCKGLIDNALSYNNQLAMNENKELERKRTIDTKTVNRIPKALDVEASEQSEI